MKPTYEELAAQVEVLTRELNNWLGIAANCAIESGVCCCGEYMKNHSNPMSCGHSPVDMADSAVNGAIEKTDKALASTPASAYAELRKEILEDFIGKFKRHVGGGGEFWLHELEQYMLLKRY